MLVSLMTVMDIWRRHTLVVTPAKVTGKEGARPQRAAFAACDRRRGDRIKERDFRSGSETSQTALAAGREKYHRANGQVCAITGPYMFPTQRELRLPGSRFAVRAVLAE
jgi:hypothetical protein